MFLTVAPAVGPDLTFSKAAAHGVAFAGTEKPLTFTSVHCLTTQVRLVFTDPVGLEHPESSAASLPGSAPGHCGS